MNRATIQKLAELTHDFYTTTHEAFDQTRQLPWQGWYQLVPHIKALAAHEPLTILDLGCGNGRFAQFLEQQLTDIGHRLLGIDANTELLERAQRLSFTKLRCNWKKSDFVSRLLAGQPLVEPDDIQGRASLIVAFGVMHHIPSFELRRQFLAQCLELLLPGGLLVVTFWQCGALDNLLKRARHPDEFNLEATQLEANDYLLDWQRGTPAVRYCHWVDEHEEQRLLDTLGVTKELSFLADGKTGSDNRYLILKR